MCVNFKLLPVMSFHKSFMKLRSALLTPFRARVYRVKWQICESSSRLILNSLWNFFFYFLPKKKKISDFFYAQTTLLQTTWFIVDWRCTKLEWIKMVKCCLSFLTIKMITEINLPQFLFSSVTVYLKIKRWTFWSA